MNNVGSLLSTELVKAKLEATSFLRSCVRGGLAHSLDTTSNKWLKPYPEVTGYLLSFFTKTSQDLDMAETMANRLMGLQRKCGGWRSFSGHNVYTFDTAQIGKGLLDFYDMTQNSDVLNVCHRAGDFILSMQNTDGSFFPIFSEKVQEKIAIGNSWGDGFSTINCKCVEYLNQMTCSGYVDYTETIKKSCAWTLLQPQQEYSHPGAYSLEGLLAGGHKSEVRQRLETHFVPNVDEMGFLPYKPGMTYAYVSGSVQIGILCAKVGLMETANRICTWSRGVQLQHKSGGLFQYANRDGSVNTDVHGEINSWGTKYYVELIHSILEETVASADTTTY